MRRLALVLGRSLIALLTVWCLGCSSFETLLASWTDRGPSQAAAYVTAEEGPSTPSGTVGDDAGRDDTCPCVHCAGARPVRPPVTSQVHPVPDTYPAAPPSFASVEHEPLVPPPRG